MALSWPPVSEAKCWMRDLVWSRCPGAMVDAVRTRKRNLRAWLVEARGGSARSCVRRAFSMDQ